MIANINPSSHTYEDTHNTLKYSNRAKNIKVNPVQRELVREGNWVEREVRLKEENVYLRNRVSELEAVVLGLREQIESLKTNHSSTTTSSSSSTASLGVPVGQVTNRVTFATTTSSSTSTTRSAVATGTVEMAPCEATYSHNLASDREVREEERRDSIIYENNISLMLDTIPEEEDGGSSYGTDSRRTSYTTNESSKGAQPRTPYTPSHYIFDMLGDEEVDHMRHTLSDSVLKAGLLGSLDDSTHPTPYKNSIRNSSTKDITSPRYRLSQSVAGSKRIAPISYSSTSNTAAVDTSYINTHTEREQKEERESSVVHVPTVKKLAFSPVASTAHNSVNKGGSSDNMDNNTSIILDTSTQVQEIADNTIESARKRRRTSHIPISKIPSTTTKRVVKSTITVPIDPVSSTSSTTQPSILPAVSSPVPTPPASSSTATTTCGLTTTSTGLAINDTVGVSKVTTRSRRQTFVDVTQNENVNPQLLPPIQPPSQLISSNNTSTGSGKHIQVEKVQKPPTGNSRRRSMEGIKAMLDSLPTAITTTDLNPTYSTFSTVLTIDSATLPMPEITGVMTRSRRSSLMAPKLISTTAASKKSSVITDVTYTGEGLSTTTTSTTGRASNRRQSSASTYTTRRMI